MSDRKKNTRTRRKRRRFIGFPDARIKLPHRTAPRKFVRAASSIPRKRVDPPATNPLSAHDAGSSVTVDVSGFAIARDGDVFRCNAGAISGLRHNAVYTITGTFFMEDMVYYEAWEGPPTSIFRNTTAMFVVGSISTPAQRSGSALKNDAAESELRSPTRPLGSPARLEELQKRVSPTLSRKEASMEFGITEKWVKELVSRKTLTSTARNRIVIDELFAAEYKARFFPIQRS